MQLKYILFLSKQREEVYWKDNSVTKWWLKKEISDHVSQPTHPSPFHLHEAKKVREALAL